MYKNRYNKQVKPCTNIYYVKWYNWYYNPNQADLFIIWQVEILTVIRGYHTNYDIILYNHFKRKERKCFYFGFWFVIWSWTGMFVFDYTVTMHCIVYKHVLIIIKKYDQNICQGVHLQWQYDTILYTLGFFYIRGVY